MREPQPQEKRGRVDGNLPRAAQDSETIQKQAQAGVPGTRMPEQLLLPEVPVCRAVGGIFSAPSRLCIQDIATIGAPTKACVASSLQMTAPYCLGE